MDGTSMKVHDSVPTKIYFQKTGNRTDLAHRIQFAHPSPRRLNFLSISPSQEGLTINSAKEFPSGEH